MLDPKPIRLTTVPENDYTGQDPQPMVVVGDIPATSQQTSGWANYADSTYTSGSPLTLSAGVDTQLLNDAQGALTNETHLPSGISTFYDAQNQKILGRDGGDIIVTLEFKATPAGANAVLDTWFDIGAPVGEIYRTPTVFPKGSGVTRTITLVISGYTLDTWDANGAGIWMNCNVDLEIHDIRYIVKRTYEAP